MAGAQSVSVSYDTIDLKLAGGITAPVGGDFNGDGVLDLVVHSADSIRIYFGKGRGTFGEAVVTPLGEVESRRYRHAAVVGDFNLDGKADYFAFQRVFLGNGDGTLRKVATIGVEDRPQLLQFNADGIPDLVGMAGNRFQIVFGSSDGKFCYPKYYCDPAIEYLPESMGLLGDVNLDGKPDAVTFSASNNTPFVEAWLGVKEETPAQGHALSQLNWERFQEAALADVNGDGRPDLILADYHIYVAAGSGDGRFGPWVKAEVSDYFDAFPDVVFGDFNRDGRVDIGYWMTHEDPEPSGEFGIAFGDGKGQFAFNASTMKLAPAPLEGGAGMVGLGDWNGDGLLDLISDDSKTLRLSLTVPYAVSSGSGEVPVAPGGLASLYLTGLAGVTKAADPLAVLPTNLGGVRVRVDMGPGLGLADAELLYVSPSQINFRVSPSSRLGMMVGQVEAAGKVTAEFQVQVVRWAPALFSTDGIHAAGGVSATASGFDVVLYATGLSGATARDVTLVVDGRVMALDSVTPLSEVTGMDLIRLRVPRPASCTGSDCGEVTVSFGWPQVLRLALKAQ